jgi:ATP-dependent DNA helicase RecQ
VAIEVWIITVRKRRVLPNAKRFKRIMRDVFGISALRSRSAGTRETRAEHEKLEQMMLYGQSSSCRWKILYDYFNEPFPQERCGHCDNCMQPIEEQLGYCDQRSDVAIA